MVNRLFDVRELEPRAECTKRPARRRPSGSGADPMVQFTLPAPVVEQIEQWARRSRRTRPQAFRELLVAGLETIEPLAAPVQLAKHKPHKQHKPRPRQGILGGI